MIQNKKHCDYSHDPLTVLGSDIMSMLLINLDAHSLASTLVVSHDWYTLASTDAIWSKKGKTIHFAFYWWMTQSANLNCEELWAGKAHLPRFLHTRGLSKLSAYSLSVNDGKRTRIMKEDLWDHAWEFHFKRRPRNTFATGTHIGRGKILQCTGTSIQMEVKRRILMTGFGAVMNVVTLL
ncbi:hypothetical protein QVD17_35448 [Tagetes erecta]|uniref:F-box protein n=1 Tax=Tagetes erecta TaxID=13708 RepID=A0AAD8NM06_TARER|nr:hypothetical protein QVD17_35448 [Tagetes erecta]